MKKWEYTFINPQDSDRQVEAAIERMNKLGGEGWRKTYPLPDYSHIIVMEREIPEPRAKKTEISLKEALSRLGEDPFMKAHREFQEVLERVRLSSLSQREISEPPANDDSEHPDDYDGLD